jgi:catechol 2,3-dioxygenase-like lactoylglutathione lyase family enzyme
VILFAGLVVADIAAARGWYERLFGREPDLVPHDREVAWQLAEAGWVYVLEDAEQAGGGLITLVVEDLDAEVAPLRERGVEVELVTEGRVRKAVVRDLDGNTIAFGQPPSA